MKTTIAFFLVFTLMVFSRCYAADAYLGIGLGQSEINQGFFGEYGNGYKIFGGVRLHKNLAIEAAYTDFGNPSENLFGVEVEYEAWAVGAWAKGLWPVSQHIEIFAKAGIAYWEADRTSTVFGLPSTKTSWDGTDFAWGVGASFNYWNNFGIQLEYEDIAAEIDTITLWSVSAIYRF
jgi:opacity protein-like surface antigen